MIEVNEDCPHDRATGGDGYHDGEVLGAARCDACGATVRYARSAIDNKWRMVTPPLDAEAHDAR